MLPVQAFQPRSPPRSHDTGMRSSHMIDMRYDDFYGGTKGASTYSTSNLEVRVIKSFREVQWSWINNRCSSKTKRLSLAIVYDSQ